MKTAARYHIVAAFYVALEELGIVAPPRDCLSASPPLSYCNASFLNGRFRAALIYFEVPSVNTMRGTEGLRPFLTPGAAFLSSPMAFWRTPAVRVWIVELNI
jgi:hypothetical protein